MKGTARAFDDACKRFEIGGDFGIRLGPHAVRDAALGLFVVSENENRQIVKCSLIESDHRRRKNDQRMVAMWKPFKNVPARDELDEQDGGLAGGLGSGFQRLARIGDG